MTSRRSSSRGSIAVVFAALALVVAAIAVGCFLPTAIDATAPAVLASLTNMAIEPTAVAAAPSETKRMMPQVTHTADLINVSKATPRAVIPLLLTHTRYHGSSLLATTLQGWILKLLVPQGNIDLIVFYDEVNAPLEDVVAMLKMKLGATRPAHISEHEHQKAMPVGYATVPSIHPSYVIQLMPVTLKMPKYFAGRPDLLARVSNDSSWMRCGCPPYCPPRRATTQYVQGTRWYTAAMFAERQGLVPRRYDYWLKLDVDIWIFRPLPFNMAEEMQKRGAVVAHTGLAYNGHGCSNELGQAIQQYCDRLGRQGPSAGGCPMASAKDAFWKQDDTVYYSNFIMSSVRFHSRGMDTAVTSSSSSAATPFGLAHFLNEEYETGFFKHRWTDQSLFHKVIGVFTGPDQSAFALDWSHLRCTKNKYHAGAVFWHSKKHKTKAELKKCTDI